MSLHGPILMQPHIDGGTQARRSLLIGQRWWNTFASDQQQGRRLHSDRLSTSKREPSSERQRQNGSERKVSKTNWSRLSQNIAFASLQADRCGACDDVVQCRTIADSCSETLSGDHCKH